ncbi:MAG: radical SAM protein [Candidatus Kerfeldbacteria bacterium]|nr:radical SAM protein [Candidatus Kerfeldbacteria bacterium]
MINKNKTEIVPFIDEIFSGQFPIGYPNVMQYFGLFSREEIENNQGKLLMLDVDFGRKCSLYCPECFRRYNLVDRSFYQDLTYQELLRVIDEARKLGLQMVKICGAGEPTEGPLFLQFARDLTGRGIGLACFTKGHVLGDDGAVRKIYEAEGINTASQLCQELIKLKVSFMLSCRSFIPEVQDRLVGKVDGYTLKRNQALVNLVDAGFNKDIPTRLALSPNPIERVNYDEVYYIYTWARRRNMFVIPVFLMTSGRQINQKFIARNDISEQKKIDLAIRIYRFNIENGLQTLKQIEQEGVSAIVGMNPCNQIGCGLYVTANGNVVGCPGFIKVEGNVRQTSLKDIWLQSENFSTRAGVFNCKCPPKDGLTIPVDFYGRVIQELKKY